MPFGVFGILLVLGEALFPALLFPTFVVQVVFPCNQFGWSWGGCGV